MKRAIPKIKKIEELEKEIISEEKKILQNASIELQKKISENDVSTIDIQKKIIAKQEIDYKNFNLRRDKAIDKLDIILRELIGREFNNSDSEHWPLFSAISNLVSSNINILEIGTADGITASILASLFPQSEIVTIDLPATNKTFKESYNRENIFNEYVDRRNNLLDQHDNISFIEMNSIKLNNWAKKSFDLIWVDGAHGYPVMPLDLYNACMLIKVSGFIVIDDIFLNLRKTDKMYRSTAAIETLRLFKDNGILNDFNLIRKRLALKHNFKGLNEKYLGVIKF